MRLRIKVVGQLPPRLDTVFRRVMYVPPTAGSDTRANRDMIDTNMENCEIYTNKGEKRETSQLL